MNSTWSVLRATPEESQSMTRDNTHHRSTSTRVRRLSTSAIVGAAIFVGLSSIGDGTAAARRTTSDSIAANAGQAVAALDRWEQTANPLDYIRFVQHRDHAASMTEREIELPAGALEERWAHVSIAKQHAVLSAISQLGVPYRSLKSEPGVGFDCSGLTVWAFNEAGVELPRISRDQINDAESLEREEAEPGDLVYYPGHVSIFIGAGMMVHSPNSGSHVEVTHLPDRSLRFGDAASAQTVDDVETDAPATRSLVDGPLAIAE
jgi:cell wall-associated NlpC family hydrolase